MNRSAIFCFQRVRQDPRLAYVAALLVLAGLLFLAASNSLFLDAVAPQRNDVFSSFGRKNAWFQQRDASGQARFDYHRQEVPNYLHEDFVLTGYRAHLSLLDCAKSMFYLHNETVNIWTHLGAAVTFWWFAFSYCKKKQYHAMVSILCASKALVFSASFFAHTFSPIHKEWYQWCWQLDWSAIAFAQFGTFCTLVTFGFYHHSRRRTVWMTVFALSCIALLLVANSQAFTAWPTAVRAVVALIPVPCFLVFVTDLYRTLPLCEFQQIFAAMARPTLLAILGMICYGGHLPERWFPGIFDFTGGSHTIHHLWTTGFALCMLQNAKRWSKWRSQTLPEAL